MSEVIGQLIYKVRLDTSEMDRQIREAEGKLRGVAQTKLQLDTSEAMKKIEAVVQAVHKIGSPVKLQLDTTEAERKIKQLGEELRKELSQNVSSGPSSGQRQLSGPQGLSSLAGFNGGTTSGIPGIPAEASALSSGLSKPNSGALLATQQLVAANPAASIYSPSAAGSALPAFLAGSLLRSSGAGAGMGGLGGDLLTYAQSGGAGFIPGVAGGVPQITHTGTGSLATPASASAASFLNQVLGATTRGAGPAGPTLADSNWIDRVLGGRTHAEGVVEQRKTGAEQRAAALADLKFARTAAGKRSMNPASDDLMTGAQEIAAAGKRSMNPASDDLMTGAQEIAAAEGPGGEAGGFNTDWIGALGRGLGRAGSKIGRFAATGSSRSLMGLAGEYAPYIGIGIGAYHLADNRARERSAVALSQERVATGGQFAAEEERYRQLQADYSTQGGVLGDERGLFSRLGVGSATYRAHPYQSNDVNLAEIAAIDRGRQSRAQASTQQASNRNAFTQAQETLITGLSGNPYQEQQAQANLADMRRSQSTNERALSMRASGVSMDDVMAYKQRDDALNAQAKAADLGAIDTKNQRALASLQMSADVTHQGYTDAAGARSSAIRNHYQELINNDPKNPNVPTWIAMSKQALTDEQGLRQNNLDSGFLSNQAGAMMVHAQVLQGQRFNYAARQQGFDAQSRSLDAEQKKAEYNLKGPELAQSQETFGIRRQEVANNKALDTQAFNDSLKYLADAAKSTGYALEGAAGQFKSSLTDIATARDKANDKEADPRVRALNNQVAKNEMQLRGQQEARRQYNQGLTTNEIEHQNAVMRLRNLGLDDEADRQAVQYNLKEQEDALNAGNFTPDELKRRRAALEDSAQQQLEHISQVEGHRQASSEGSFMQAFDFSDLNAKGMVNKPLDTGDSKTDAQLLTENKNIQDTINAADGQAGGGNSGQLVALLQQIAANTAKQFAAQ